MITQFIFYYVLTLGGALESWRSSVNWGIENNSIVHFQSIEDKRTLDTLLDRRVKELKEYRSDNEANYIGCVYAMVDFSLCYEVYLMLHNITA